MRRLPLLLVLLIALAGVLPAGAPAAEAQSAALKKCHTSRTFMTGPFYVDRVRARGVSCRKARGVTKGWGRRDSCTSDNDDRVCRVRRWRCKYTDIPNYEGGRVRCTRGKKRAIGFRFGS